MKKIVGVAFLVLLLAGCGAGSSKGSSAVATQTAAPAKAATEAEKPKEEKSKAKYVVTIDGTSVGADYKGNKALVVTYTFTNNSEKAANFMFATRAKAFQNGVELSSAIGVDSVDASNSMKDVKPGATITFNEAYTLTDASEVEVIVTELFDDESIATTKVKVS